MDLVTSNDLRHGGKHRLHFINRLVARNSIAEPAVNRPDLVHLQAVGQLPHLLVGGGGEVLHDRVPLDTGLNLGCRGSRETGPLVPQKRQPDGRRYELHDDGRGRRGGLAHDDLLGFTLDPVRVGDGVGQGRDGVQLLVGFGSCEDWLDNAVVDSFDESPGRIGSVLLLASSEPKQPHSVPTGLLVSVVVLLLE